MARTEVFGRSALTGMHTYADSLFFVNRPGVPTDGLDIVDLAPDHPDAARRRAAGRHGRPRAPPGVKKRREPRVQAPVHACPRPLGDCRRGRLRV